MALSTEVVSGVITELLAPGHFWCAPSLRLEWQGPVQEEVPWEIFRGQLLDRRHCRESRTFITWKVFIGEEGDRSREPLLAVYFDVPTGQLHVVRAVCVLAWEGYAEGKVILSRQVPHWQREWVGGVALCDLSTPAEVRQELAELLFQAVVGTSRLPLTSLQTPLPAFLLGWLAYWPVAWGSAPLSSWRELFREVLPRLETEEAQARLLEVVLRNLPAEETAAAAHCFRQVWTAQEGTPAQAAHLLRTLVNQVSLSPWTDLVPRMLELVQTWTVQGWWPADLEVDLLASWLLQLSRHLTAYDLVIFHHRGANYPDALFLDALLRRYSTLIAERPELFSGNTAAVRRRRRALRQGWHLRRHYEGLPVPAIPTSPGENLRIWPVPRPQVSEEHLHHPPSRPCRLFANQPPDYLDAALVRQVLAASLDDLAHPQELRELGLGLFLDRPLGAAKHPLEPDQTVLLSYLAFSRTLAQSRLHELAEQAQSLKENTAWEALHQALRQMPIAGLPLTAIASAPGRIVSLADAARVAPDFLLLRTTRQTLADFLRQYDFTSISKIYCLDFLLQRQEALLVPVAPPPGEELYLLALYDAQLRRRLELGFPRSASYVRRRGQEYLRDGLQLQRYWPAEGAGPVQDLRAAGVVAPPWGTIQSSSRKEVEICT